MSYPAQTTQHIIERIFRGESLRKVLQSNNLDAKTFFETIYSNSELAQRYALAQKSRAELLADEIVDIADEERDPQQARNRIDARKWWASKINAQKYGDRIDLNVTNTVDIGAALTEARQRTALPMCYPERVIEGQVIDSQAIDEGSATGSEPVDAQESANANDSRDVDPFS